MRLAAFAFATVLLLVGHAAVAAGGLPARLLSKADSGARRTAAKRPRAVPVAHGVEAIQSLAVGPDKRFLAEPEALVLHGSVLTATGLPLPGATVWVVGKPHQMGVADAQGNFTLLLPDNGPVQLNYEAAGYRRERVALDQPTTRTMPAINLLAVSQN